MDMKWIMDNSSLIVMILLLLLIGFGCVLIYRKCCINVSVNSEAPMFFYIVLPIALILFIGLLLVSGTFAGDPEIQVGFLVVVAIIALIGLLFIVAAGFAHLKLANDNRALGLPEGSIRAMIALILIMVFIIFGIYLFRMTGQGYFVGPVVVTQDQLTSMLVLDKRQIGKVEIIKEKDAPTEKVKVWLRENLSDDGSRLGQQLLTIVGTLVVAVAGFYFGSSNVGTATAAIGKLDTKLPIIQSITPSEGKKDTKVILAITGKNFQMPRSVKLKRGTEEINGHDIMASSTKITCSITLDKGSSGENWDVIVQDDTDNEYRLVKAFKITV